MRRKRAKETSSIHRRYRRALKLPGLTEKQVEEMRVNLVLLAQTICEHVWGKRFY